MRLMVIKLESISNSVPDKKYQIQNKEILSNGMYRVIDQSSNLAGYSDNDEKLFSDVPVIAFADHSEKLYYMERPFIIGCDGIKLIKICDDYDGEFIYYYLKAKYKPDGKYRRHYADLRTLEVRLLPIEKQKEIATVLSGIDKKILNNTAICSLLGSMAKLLYDYWFVQFDFPDENGKPYKSSGGKMVWNEELKREIPEGWEVKTINDVIKQLSGYPFPSDAYVSEGKYKLYTIKNVQDGYIESRVDNCLNEIPNRMDEGCLLSVGDMIMSLTGNVGRVGIVYEDNALLNQRVLKLVPTVSSKMYIRQFMMSDEMRYRIGQIAVGTSQKNLSPVEFGELIVLYPPDLIMDLYKNRCDNMYDTIVSKLQENQQLTSLRDFLLPMLMNGQVKVCDN